MISTIKDYINMTNIIIVLLVTIILYILFGIMKINCSTILLYLVATALIDILIGAIYALVKNINSVYSVNKNDGKSSGTSNVSGM